jgi:ribosomal protein L37AE/L43A
MNCPDCGREMKPKTARTPEKAWVCEYCEATWKPVRRDEEEAQG